MTSDIRLVLGKRLREERERLGLSQTALAALGGAKMRTLQDWERGLSAVQAEFLAAVGAHGVDVQYIITGHALFEGKQGTALRAEEAALLENYRASDDEGRAAARKVMAALAGSASREVEGLAQPSSK